MMKNRVNEEICMISQVETKCVDEVVKDNHWIQEMKEEMDQIQKIDKWELVSRPKDKNVLGKKGF